MTDKLTDLNTAALDASRPEPDLKLAQDISEIFTHMLGDGKSIIDPDVTIWTADAAEELKARIADNSFEGKSLNQWQKLDIQLEGASREVVLLAAEIVFLREYPLYSALPQTRRSHVELVLKHLDSQIEVPKAMSTWMDRPSGIAGFKPGQGYNGGMWRHIIWMTNFIQKWNLLSDVEQEAARSNPWKLQEVVLSVDEDRSDIRNALQALARPAVFELISSALMKKDIRDKLSHRISGSSGTTPAAIDQDLLKIRASLTSEIKGPFHFWSPGVKELWDKTAPKNPAEELTEPRPRHYWLFAPGRQASKWEEFYSKHIMAIGWDGLGDLTKYSSQEEVREALDVEESGTAKRNDSLAVWQFQNEIAVGDVIYAKRGTQSIIGRGEVTSDARFEPEHEKYHHVRSVEWTHDGSWDYPETIPLKTLTDITSKQGIVEKLESLFAGEEEPEILEITTPLPGYGKQEFLSEVYLPEERYDRLRSLLRRKKNVILAGPPGVGKTFTAKRLAYSIMGQKDPSRVQMVQFHQSYSYEDFMMGYRPTEAGGFSLAEGPFYRFCDKARADDANRPYFFIIDEINRGNISKIFGELLMLIEADKRGQDLRLLYKNEKFSVPGNIHIIGMMNTADRSLAVLDYALRRRFGFFDMEPGFESEGFLLRQQSIEDPAFDRLVKSIIELNKAIVDDPALGRGFTIGHSYLSGAATDEDDWLNSVVEDELIPLLDEYWFDEPAKAKEWALILRAALQ